MDFWITNQSRYHDFFGEKLMRNSFLFQFFEVNSWIGQELYSIVVVLFFFEVEMEVELPNRVFRNKFSFFISKRYSNLNYLELITIFSDKWIRVNIVVLFVKFVHDAWEFSVHSNVLCCTKCFHHFRKFIFKIIFPYISNYAFLRVISFFLHLNLDLWFLRLSFLFIPNIPNHIILLLSLHIQ